MNDTFIHKEVIEAKLNMKAPSIERICGFAQRSLSDQKFLELPETQALLKMLYSMPWLIEVIDSDFDPEIARGILVREAGNVMITEAKDAVQRSRESERIQSQEEAGILSQRSSEV